MYKKILIIAGVIWNISSFSQTDVTPLTDSYQPPQTVINKTVHMLPGFHADSKNVIYNNGGQFIARSENVSEPIKTQAPVVYNPYMGDNYIYTRNYLTPVTESNNYAPQIQNISYFDGLGRVKQNISIKSTPGGNDLVTKIEYDSFGRQDTDYLSMPQQGSTNSAFYNSVSESIGSSLYGNGPYFSKKDLENSPLDRINATTAPGDWNTKDKKVAFEYLTNSSNEVIKFTTSTIWNQGVTVSSLYLSDNSTNSTSGYYNADKLFKNKVTDEDGNISYEFKNGQGQAILVRKVLDGSPPLDTYNVYNEYDQLAFVISPMAVKSIQDAGLGDGDLISITSILDPLCYQYHYDSKSRLAEKKLPGKGWEYMIYDQEDRLVATQDAELGKSKKWLFTKYDQYGRVAFAGTYTSTQSYGSSGRNSEQSLADGKGSNNVSRDDSLNTTVNNIKLYYSHSGTYPETISELLTINYYDTYPPYTDLPSVGSYDQYGQKFLTQVYTSSESNLHTKISTMGLATAIMMKNIVGNAWTKNYTFYDQKARSIYTHSINYLNGYTKTGSLLDFSGAVLKSYTKHKRSSGSTPAEVTINERFVHDHQNRLKQHYHQVDNKSEVLLTDNTYDELSRLSIKKIGNELQTMKYKYNIRGWLISINDPASNVTMGSDLFGYRIRYNEPIAGLLTPNALDYSNLQVKEKYNGNIAEVDWNSVEVGSLDPMTLPYRYGYVYDNLNRLKAGFYQNPYDPAKGEGNEIIDEYDLNGNIVKLKRFAYKPKSRIAQKIDDLVYHYSGNQVTKIDDNPGQLSNPLGYPGGSGAIEYDLNGNMNLMQDKGISKIEYNYLNLPTKIVQPNPTSYTYRADGVKLSKSFTVNNDTGSATIRTEYLDGFQYNSGLSPFGREVLNADDPMTINSLKAGQIEAFRPVDEDILIDTAVPDTDPVLVRMDLQFFPTSEGFYDYKNSKYIYQYKDHLGNVRLSYSKNTTTNQPEVLDRNDYYPFGMNVTENYSVFDAQGTPFNYKYNGKELQETGMYAMDFRHYMPDVGRFIGVDRLAELSPHLSSYRFGFNNPILYSDPSGFFETRFGAWWHRLWNGGNDSSDIKFSAKKNEYYYNRLNDAKGNEVNFTSIYNNQSKDAGNFVFKVELSGSFGVQAGAKIGGPLSLSGEAGVISTDLGKTGWSNYEGFYAKEGDGKGHNFISVGAKVLSKSVSVGGKADYVTNHVIPTAGDLLKYYPKNGHLEWEANLGPGESHWSPPKGSGADILNVGLKSKLRTSNRENCAFCADLGIGFKAFLGIDLKLVTGFTGSSK